MCTDRIPIARRKAEAEAAAIAKREKQLVGESKQRKGTNGHNNDRRSSPVSSLTDVEEGDKEHALEGGPSIRSARSKTSSREQGSVSSRPSKPSKSKESGAVDAALDGPSAQVESPKKPSGRIDREKREEIMGPPPKIGDKGLEDGALGEFRALS